MSLELALAEREALRPHRKRNYRVKWRDGFKCAQEGCEVDHACLVVRIAPGEDDADFSIRCQAHAEEFEIQPGQWNDRSEFLAP